MPNTATEIKRMSEQHSLFNFEGWQTFQDEEKKLKNNNYYCVDGVWLSPARAHAPVPLCVCPL